MIWIERERNVRNEGRYEFRFGMFAEYLVSTSNHHPAWIGEILLAEL